jgi:hypothetical protein
MGEHTLNLKFSLDSWLDIPVGVYCDFQGERYTLESPANVKKNNIENFEYDLILQSDQYKLSKFIFRNTVPGDRRLKFSYTAQPLEFLQLLVDNMNSRDEQAGWYIGDGVIESAEKVVSFNHNTCAEALQMIAEAFETEWEVKGRGISLRKVEYNRDNPLPLSYGKGNGFLPGLGRSEYSDVKPVERLFIQGSDRNIDPNSYRKSRGLIFEKSLYPIVSNKVDFLPVSYFRNLSGVSSPAIRALGAIASILPNNPILDPPIPPLPIPPPPVDIIPGGKWVWSGQEFESYSDVVRAGGDAYNVYARIDDVDRFSLSFSNVAQSEVGNNELLMPAGATIKFDGTYFDDEDGFNPDASDVRQYVTDSSGASVVRTVNQSYKSLIEGSLEATDIYPMREGTITGVKWEWKGNEYASFEDAIAAGAKSNEVFCDIFDSSIPDNLDYSASDLRIAGEKATVIFQSGMLTGKEFDILQTENALTGYIHSERRFKLVTQEVDGMDMPGGSFSPVVGDRYAVFHIGMPQSYILDAERRLLKEAVRHLYENEMPRFTFSGTLDGIWAKRNWVNVGGRIVLGGFIRFSDTQFLPEGMDIRIVGIKDYVNNPYKPEIDLSNNSQPAGSWVHGMKRQIASDEVTADMGDRKVVQYTKRRFRDVQQTMDMLREAALNFDDPANPITLQTMQAVIGDVMLQFDFEDPDSGDPISKGEFRFDASDENTFHAPAGRIIHKTLSIDTISSSLPNDYPYRWDMPEFRSAPLDDPAKAHYLYAVVPDTTGAGAGRFELSTSGRPFEYGGMFNLLVGILNSELNGARSFAPLYGFTEILPGRITTDKIVSEDGKTYFDLQNNEIGGRINFKDGLISSDVGIGNDNGVNAGMSGAGGGTGGANQPTDIRLWAGASVADKATAPFRVQHDGTFYASNANISGTINATKGVFAGHIRYPFVDIADSDAVYSDLEESLVLKNDLYISASPRRSTFVTLPDTPEYIGATIVLEATALSGGALAVYATKRSLAAKIGILTPNAFANGAVIGDGVGYSSLYITADILQFIGIPGPNNICVWMCLSTLHDKANVSTTLVSTAPSIVMEGLPTEAAGLPSGYLWRDSNGYLRIV